MSEPAHTASPSGHVADLTPAPQGAVPSLPMAGDPATRSERALEVDKIGTWEFDARSATVDPDARVRAWLGLPATRDAVGLREFLDCFSVSGRARLELALTGADPNRAATLEGLEVPCGNGAPRRLCMRLSRVGHEQTGGALAVCTDEAEYRSESGSEHARLSEAEAIVRAISSILITLDGEHRVRMWNGEAERVLGSAEAEVIGKRIDALVGLDDGTLATAVDRAFADQRPVRIQELRFPRPNCAPAFIGLTVNPFVADGERRCVIFGRDITQQKNLDTQLAHALKLESIGQLAAGIAHEINTPTQFVGDNVRFLKDAFAELAPALEALRAGGGPRAQAGAPDVDLAYLTEEIPRAITESLSGLARISKIVGAMKDFSHPGSGEKVSVDLNRAIESTTTVTRNEWKYVADLVLDFAPDLPAVPCLPDEFNQVVLNMVVNAAHAIAERYAGESGRKGKITISTRCADDHVEVRIGDDGAGIPAAIRGRIFDPFFTTKGVGKGTGQGLAISRSVVVDKHGGSIDVESTIGVGTTFIVRLPLAPGGRRADTQREAVR